MRDEGDLQATRSLRALRYSRLASLLALLAFIASVWNLIADERWRSDQARVIEDTHAVIVRSDPIEQRERAEASANEFADRYLTEEELQPLVPESLTYQGTHRNGFERTNSKAVTVGVRMALPDEPFHEMRVIFYIHPDGNSAYRMFLKQTDYQPTQRDHGWTQLGSLPADLTNHCGIEFGRTYSCHAVRGRVYLVVPLETFPRADRPLASRDVRRVELLAESFGGYLATLEG